RTPPTTVTDPTEKGASSGVKKHPDNSRNPRSPLRGILFSRFLDLLSKTNERAHHRARKQVVCATEKHGHNRDHSTVPAGHHRFRTALLPPLRTPKQRFHYQSTFTLTCCSPAFHRGVSTSTAGRLPARLMSFYVSPHRGDSTRRSMTCATGVPSLPPWQPFPCSQRHAPAATTGTTPAEVVTSTPP